MRISDWSSDVCSSDLRNAIGIYGRIVEAFRLQKDLVLPTLGEAHHLVLNGRAVTRPCGSDLPGIEGRAVQVGTDQRVPSFRSVGDVAGDLGLRNSGGQCREEFRRIVSDLLLQHRVVDGPSVETGRQDRKS